MGKKISFLFDLTNFSSNLREFLLYKCVIESFFRVLRNGLWPAGIQGVRYYAASANLKEKTIGVIGLGQVGNESKV